MLLRNALVNRSAHPLAACLRRYGHRALSALRQCMRNLLREHICAHAGHGKRYLVLYQVFRQLCHLRMVGNGSAHQAHLFRALGALGDICQNIFQLTRTRLAEAIACHTEAAVTSAATRHLDDKHILKFRSARNDSRGVRISVDITRPLARYLRRRTFLRQQGGKLALVIVLRRIQAGNINARHLRQRRQALLLAFLAVDGIQHVLYCFLALADNKGVSHSSQRLGIKGGTGTADNHQRLALIALRRPQADIAQIQHRQQIIIVHFKGQHDEDNVKICQRTLVFQAQQRCFAFDMLLLQSFIRQKEALAGTVAALVNHLIQNVHPQVRHAQMVDIGVNKGYRMA